MKVLRFGQAEPITRQHYLKLRNSALNDQHRLFFDIAWFTAERPSAILALGVEDVYLNPWKREPRKQVNFKGYTRKTGDTRQARTSSELAMRLRSINPPSSGWLFPSLVRPGQHLGLRAIDRAFRRCCDRAGLSSLGYSLYSFRRGALTLLRQQGFDLRAIQQFSGHKSLSSLARYLDVPESAVIEMVERL